MHTMRSSTASSTHPAITTRSTVWPFSSAREKVTFDRPHWGVLGDPASPDLFRQTAAVLRRFNVLIHS